MKRKRRTRVGWSADELQIIRDRYAEEGARRLTARLPGRSWWAICKAASRLGIASGTRNKPLMRSTTAAAMTPWSERELQRLMKYYRHGGLDEAVRKLPGRSRDAIRWRAAQMRLKSGVTGGSK